MRQENNEIDIHPSDGVDIHLDESGAPRIIKRAFIVNQELAGMRLDRFIVAKIPRLSRTKIQKMIGCYLERSSGRPLKPNSKVELGECIVAKLPARPEPPCPRYFSPLYRDARVLVVNKPAGLPVHATAKFYFNTLTRVLLEHFGEPPPQICHRIDRETSGCLLVAFDKSATIFLKNAFASKIVKKTYLALVHGCPPWSEPFPIDLPIGLVDPNQSKISIRMIPRSDAPPARTIVRVIAQPHPNYAVVECKPISGRQHQIRAHLSSVGFPIVGDKLYGHGDDLFQEFCDRGMTPEMLGTLELPRHALHAAQIIFPHPQSKIMVTVDCPMPSDMKNYIDSGCQGTDDNPI